VKLINQQNVSPVEHSSHALFDVLTSLAPLYCNWGVVLWT